MASPTIFISYRREDSVGHAGRLYDRLAERFGEDHVYRDIDTIPPGADFVEAVRQKINQSNILLALIGPRWLTATDEQGHWRLADPNDLVRVEIVSALSRNIRVIPVLLQGATMPKAKDLPGELSKLAQRNAIEIRDTNFDLDTTQLIRNIGPSWRYELVRIFARWPVYAAAAIVLLTLTAVWIYPEIAFTPEKARIQLVQMGLSFNADTLVERAKHNDMQAIKLFMHAGMAVDAQDQNGETALMWATANGHDKLVNYLIERGADIDKALPVAANREQKAILLTLLQHGPGPESLNRALHRAAAAKYPEVLELLLSKGAKVDFVDPESATTALIEACDHQQSENVRLLLAQGAEVNQLGSEDKHSALIVAARRLNGEIVQLLLAHGADVNGNNADGSTPLHEAIVSALSGDEQAAERLQVVQMLLEKGADTSVRANWMHDFKPTPLLSAIHRNQAEIALLLIEKGAQVNAKSVESDGTARSSALTLAVEKGMTAVVNALLEKGAEVNFKNADGDSALLIAADSPDGDRLLELLKAFGADVTVTNDAGETVLMKAAASRYFVLNEQQLQWMLSSGVKLDAVDDAGWTALMYAAKAGAVEVAELLLRHGANAAVRNDEGDTALGIADAAGHKKLVKLLKSQ